MCPVHISAMHVRYIDVKIRFGGEANWQAHLASTAHQQQEKISSKNKSITSFFQKAIKTPHPQPGLSTSHLAAFTLSASLPSMCCLIQETEELDQMKLRRIVMRKRRKRRRIMRLTCVQTTDVNPSSMMSSSCNAMPQVVT